MRLVKHRMKKGRKKSYPDLKASCAITTRQRMRNIFKAFSQFEKQPSSNYWA